MFKKIKNLLNKEVEINLITFPLKILFFVSIFIYWYNLTSKIEYLQNSLIVEKMRNENMMGCLKYVCTPTEENNFY